MRYAIVLVLLSACGSARMVEVRGAGGTSPMNERPGGRIQYLNGGIASVMESRRADAYRQMSEHCRGRYFIEGERDVSVMQVSESSSRNYGRTTSASAVSYELTHHVIEFACAP